MTETQSLDGPRQEPAAGGAARQLVILLHGLGADGNDLIALAPILGQVLPHAAFVSPDAPFPCDMAPFGRQWFSLQQSDPQSLTRGVRQAAPILQGFIDAELERHGLSGENLALFGFSQGGMMALHVGLRGPVAPAAILGFSSALIDVDGLPEEIRHRPPVLLVHGNADEVIPSTALAAASAALQANRVPVTTDLRPGLGHGIDEEGLRLAAATLSESFGSNSD
ncbi:MAG: dienelactone hydrolase family protein [Rhodovibrionaceae bacterium]|nr:dienelactone hydrolase family protein [Rhodovibrionaceae bacterium]